MHSATKPSSTHRRFSRSRRLLLPLSLLAAAACGEEPAGGEPPAVDYAIAWLTADLEALLAATDVRSVRFEVVRVGCAGESVEPESFVGEAPLEEHGFPAENPTFAHGPLEPGSQHLFADNYMVLSPGCYDIVATPLTDQGTPSVQCSPAHRDALEVAAGATSEIVLVLQCQTEDMGGGDVAAVLNHAPRLTDLTLPNGRFGDRCAPQAVCVTAHDAESDSLELVWSSAEGSALPHAGPVVDSSTQLPDGSLRQCVRFLPQAVGEYQFMATAYDLVRRPDGSVVRIEDWLAASGTPEPSHASVTFALHASQQGPVPGPELCDAVDNDCDFEVDEGTCDGALKVQYRTGRPRTNDALEPMLRIVNESAEVVPLAALTLRYFYTIEAVRPETFQCLGATVGCSAVTGATFVNEPSRPRANRYLQVGFTGSAGTLQPGQAVELDLRVTKAGGSYSENNDYSFDDRDAFADWERVLLYRAGTAGPVWGTGP